MRRCVKYRAMILLWASLALAAFAGPSFAAVNAVQTSTWNAWADTAYYFAKLSGPATLNGSYTSYTMYVTAADDYSIWVNGDSLATNNDGDCTTIDSVTVAVASKSELAVAVRVVNSGLGNGNGILVYFKATTNNAETDWLGTTTMKRRGYYNTVTGVQSSFAAQWYYCMGDIATITGRADWYNYDPAAQTTAVRAAKGFGEVILGKFEHAINFTPDSHIEVVAGYSGGIEIGSHAGGGIGLRSVDGENLAYGKACTTTDKATNGDLSSAYSFTSNAENDSSAVVIDLGRYYLLNKVRWYTAGSATGGSVTLWPNYAVLGYTIWTSLTGRTGSWIEGGSISEVGESNADNGGYDYAEITMSQMYARYVRPVVDEERTSHPFLAEFMAFGTGYCYTGTYTSPWIDFGTPTAVKNFKTVTWTGTVPAMTSITLQTQSMDAAGDTSAWSDDHAENSFDFDSPEPGIKFRYRVNLNTESVNVTPVLKSVSVSYSDVDQPIVSGSASIVPASVPMNVDTTFCCTVVYSLAAGQNIKDIVVAVPNMATASLVEITDGPTKTTLYDGTGFTTSSTFDTLRVALNDSITNTVAGEDTIRVYFRTRLLVDTYEFGCGVMNAGGNDGAGPLVLAAASSTAMRVNSSTAMENIISGVAAIPKAFSPNGDGINDFTVVEFTLAHTTTDIIIKIFDSRGRLVRTLWNDRISARDYRVRDDDKLGNASLAKKLPGYWDGHDNDGKLVAPGIYIYQIVADSDNGETVRKGTIAVGY